MTINATYNKNYLTITATIQTKIENLIEYCKKSYENIKLTIKKENKFKLYEIIDNDMHEISNILRKNEEIFFKELEGFVQIRSSILYIVGQNCKNPKFGHFDSIKYLLNIFKELIKSKFEYLKNQKTPEEYKTHLEGFSEKLKEYQKFFSENILIIDKKYAETINKLDIALKCD